LGTDIKKGECNDIYLYYKKGEQYVQSGNDYPKPMAKANITFTVHKKKTDYTTSIRIYVSLQTYLTICVVVDEIILRQDKPPLFIVNWSESLLIL
jgi:hypothetical protein